MCPLSWHSFKTDARRQIRGRFAEGRPPDVYLSPPRRKDLMTTAHAQAPRNARIEALRLVAILAIAVFHTFQPWFAAATADSWDVWVTSPAMLAALGCISLLGAYEQPRLFPHIGPLPHTARRGRRRRARLLARASEKNRPARGRHPPDRRALRPRRARGGHLGRPHRGAVAREPALDPLLARVRLGLSRYRARHAAHGLGLAPRPPTRPRGLGARRLRLCRQRLHRLRLSGRRGPRPPRVAQAHERRQLPRGVSRGRRARRAQDRPARTSARLLRGGVRGGGGRGGARGQHGPSRGALLQVRPPPLSFALAVCSVAAAAARTDERMPARASALVRRLASSILGFYVAQALLSPLWRSFAGTSASRRSTTGSSPFSPRASSGSAVLLAVLLAFDQLVRIPLLRAVRIR